MAITGLDCNFYLNSATYATPTWGAVDNVREVNMSGDTGEADASRRGSGGWKEYLTTLKDATLEVQMVYENGDTDMEAFRDAWLNRTSVDVWAADGVVADPADGLRMVAVVTGFSRPEPLEDTVVVDITLRPTPNSDSPPTWHSA
jgi:hypothetical protein